MTVIQRCVGRHHHFIRGVPPARSCAQAGRVPGARPQHRRPGNRGPCLAALPAGHQPQPQGQAISRPPFIPAQYRPVGRHPQSVSMAQDRCARADARGCGGQRREPVAGLQEARPEAAEGQRVVSGPTASRTASITSSTSSSVMVGYKGRVSSRRDISLAIGVAPSPSP